MTPPRLDEPISAAEPTPMVADDEPQAEKLSGRSKLKQVLKIVLGLGLIVFLFHKTGLEEMMAKLATANLWYIPVGVGLYLLAQVFSTYRWKFLAEALNFRLSLRELYDYYMIGMFSNQFLPGSIGGDAVRMVFLARSCNRRKREALLTIMAERGVGLIAMLIITGLMCLMPSVAAEDWHLHLHPPMLPAMVWDVRLTMLGLTAAAFLGYLSLWVLPLDRLAAKYPKLALLTQAKMYWADVPMLGKSILISVMVQAIMIAIHVMVAQALDIHLPVLQLAVIYGMVSLVSVLPVTPSGLGVREGAYQLLMNLVGIPPASGLAFGVYWLVISTVTSMIGGLVLIKGHYKTPTPQEVERL